MTVQRAVKQPASMAQIICNCKQNILGHDFIHHQMTANYVEYSFSGIQVW